MIVRVPLDHHLWLMRNSEPSVTKLAPFQPSLSSTIDLFLYSHRSSASRRHLLKRHPSICNLHSCSFIDASLQVCHPDEQRWSCFQGKDSSRVQALARGPGRIRPVSVRPPQQITVNSYLTFYSFSHIQSTCQTSWARDSGSTVEMAASKSPPLC